MTVPEISVQLYAIHHELDADLDGSLGRLAEIGFRNVEAFDFVRRVDALKTSFDRHGLSAPTAHALILTDAVDTPDHLLKVATAAETFEAAAALGIKLVIDPFVAADQWTSRTDIERTADTLNALEVDLYWAAASGVDPVALVQRLGDRVHAVHIKDGPMRAGISTRELPKDQCPAGKGDVPLTAALAASSAIAYAVVEFDHYQGDIFAGIAESYAFLDTALAAAR